MVQGTLEATAETYVEALIKLAKEIEKLFTNYNPAGYGTDIGWNITLKITETGVKASVAYSR